MQPCYRGTWVWTICLELLLDNNQTGSWKVTWLKVRYPSHCTTRPPLFSCLLIFQTYYYSYCYWVCCYLCDNVTASIDCWIVILDFVCSSVFDCISFICQFWYIPCCNWAGCSVVFDCINHCIISYCCYYCRFFIVVYPLNGKEAAQITVGDIIKCHYLFCTGWWTWYEEVERWSCSSSSGNDAGFDSCC